uniref:Rne/Rng family ribonuclease n=1 Tax=Phytoactinopolyspora halotolerans TaxID=1981512 RepID=UPI001C205923|nr:Rne/Rng family ribonuclease [Phytoactinopolyspora halotolerans]
MERTAKKSAAKKATKKSAAKKPAAKRSAKKSAATTEASSSAASPSDGGPSDASPSAAEPDAGLTRDGHAEDTAAQPPKKRPSRSRKKSVAAAEAAVGENAALSEDGPVPQPMADAESAANAPNQGAESAGDSGPDAVDAAASAVLFQPPTFDATPLFEPPTVTGRGAEPADEWSEQQDRSETEDTESSADEGPGDDGDDEDSGSRRRRRRRGGRGRRKKPEETAEDGTATPSADENVGDDKTAAPTDTDAESAEQSEQEDTDSGEESGDDGSEGGSRRRRRRRRRKSEGDGEDGRTDDPPNTVVRVRDSKESEDEVSVVKGSTRLEAKKQRRREGREAGRRRPPILSESEFLARREAVERVMAVRQEGDLTQIAVLEDDILVEHYVSRASQQSMIGNVYLGRVQNVLPAMEAAFIDIGRGRNAVVYAGEVDWAGLGHTEGPKRIEDVLKSGQTTLVQVTKDPVGHKGARLTGQISLPGRYVVYVPGGSMSGISRKLPDNERNRLKKILKKVVPEDAGVIVRTAAEGASEEELTNDVARLKAQWEAIQKKTSGSAPALLHGEPDLAIKVVRDLFNEDFTKLVVHGKQAWEAIDEYVSGVASSLKDRVEKWTSHEDMFASLRIDEQISKALDRKVWLPSGGSLVIDRTEAMTVIDVNTGKFTGSGGNLEETVTKNNLEAAEEIVRQLRLRDIGGIIVIDFIDMVLESNRDLVLRRLVECLGRDRTKHQVAEVTSLGLVQMTRKRIGTGLLEAFSEQCSHCKGRGIQVHTHVREAPKSPVDETPSKAERRGKRGKRSEPQEKPAEAALAPKLEAHADPGEASPADLMPVGLPVSVSNGTSEDVAGAETSTNGRSVGARESGAPSGTAAADSAATGPGSAATDSPTTGTTASDTPATGTGTGSTAAGAGAATGGDGAKPPARRGRRRAERPAGSPDEHVTSSR